MRKILKGLGVSLGKASGKVKIIRNTKNSSKFKEGNILVCKITNPAMVSMMARASAIICDIGGMTSHPSIIAREMGIPCVVGTKKATKILKNNMEILIDGRKGEIYEITK